METIVKSIGVNGKKDWNVGRKEVERCKWALAS